MITPDELRAIQARASRYAKVLGNPTGETLNDLSDIGLMAVVDIPRLIYELSIPPNVEITGAQRPVD